MEKTISPWQIIEKLRRKKGIPKKILAEKLQINYNYLVDLLNGRYQSKIDDDKLRTISIVLDLPIHNLLDELHGVTTPDGARFSEVVPSGIPPVGKTPVFRIVSGSKIDPAFNQPEPEGTADGLAKGEALSELWAQKNLEFAYVPSLRETPDKPISFQPLGKQGILPATVAIKLEDNSLFPPCLAGSIFIIDTTKKPRIGDIVLVVLQNYRAWVIELNKIDSTPDKEKVFFRAYNSDFEPIMVNRKDIIFLFPVIWIHPA